jgi:hypothetical protein
VTDTTARLTTSLADRYRVERELGSGGMATVYLAHDLRHDRDVAVKVLHPDLGAALGGERFLSEIKTTARLQHPHILPLLDSGETDGLLYGAFLMFSDRAEDGLAVLRDLKRRDPTYALVALMEDLGEAFAGHFAGPLARLADGPRYAPPAIWYLVQGLVGLAAGDQTHALRALDLSAAGPPDAMSGLSTFLAAATRADGAAAMAVLTPELEASLWQDFSYAEYAAQGFALLGDVGGVHKWLTRATDLGAGYSGALTLNNAVWRPWLAHPDVAPIFERVRANAARYATIPLAPRAAALTR